jgi:hypothetical protein
MKKLIVSFIFLMALGIISAEASNFSLSIGAGTRNVKGVENENGINLYKEENVIGTMDEVKFSFFGEGGLQFRFTPLLFLDLKVKYIFLKVDGPAARVDLGGLALIGGMGISF